MSSQMLLKIEREILLGVPLIGRSEVKKLT